MALYQHPPTISYGVARWNQKKVDWTKSPKRKSRKRMQKKDNAPCHNQISKKNQKSKTERKGKLLPRKLSPKKCPKRTGSNRIPPLPPLKRVHLK
jgi:hypothetical protein